MNQPPKLSTIDAALKFDHPDSRTFVEYKTPFEGTPSEGFQGTWVELTTFVGNGLEKRRFDFAWPTKLWENLPAQSIAALVKKAIDLELS